VVLPGGFTGGFDWWILLVVLTGGFDWWF